MTRRFLSATALAAALWAPALAQNRIDVIAPMAPELAAFGRFDIGVRTVTVTDRGRPDILRITEGGPTVLYDRRLTLEVWYPATLAAGQRAEGRYRVITRDPSVQATLVGRAVREAAPAAGGPFPLVIVSHGYPGNRFLMSHLCENLASKGFVVAAIDHPDSTYDDQKAFASTLYNRAFDQLFVLNEMARLGREAGFLRGLVDADRTGLVGYSMGGYGVMNVIGAGYSKASESFQSSPPNRLLAARGAGNPDYSRTIDPRIRAAVAVAPWGMQTGFWEADGLRGVKTPVLFVAGSADEVAGYEKGTRAIFEGVVNADRYLLTYTHANHNAGAPIPAPVETYAYSEAQQSFPFMHYADAVWDSTRMNNILQHFATAYFEWHLRGGADRQTYFDLVPNGADGKYSVGRDGAPGADHTYWKGFKRGTAVGLTLEHRPAAR